MDIHTIKVKNRTFLCISCSICPIIYVKKRLFRLTYERTPAKGSNPVITRNRRTRSSFQLALSGIIINLTNTRIYVVRKRIRVIQTSFFFTVFSVIFNNFRVLWVFVILWILCNQLKQNHTFTSAFNLFVWVLQPPLRFMQTYNEMKTKWWVREPDYIYLCIIKLRVQLFKKR